MDICLLKQLLGLHETQRSPFFGFLHFYAAKAIAHMLHHSTASRCRTGQAWLQVYRQVVLHACPANCQY